METDEMGASREARGRGLVALVAEDNAVNQLLVARLLEKRGYSAVVVENGRQAVEAISREPFDFVLMDIQMPEMSGVEATVAIREQEARLGRRVPIIALTANAMAGDRERFLAAGMDGYISKPIDSRRLFETIEELTRKSSEIVATAAASAMGDEILERDTILERFDGDSEFIAEVVEQFVSDLPRILGALREAASGGDSCLLERAAHSLKGAASNFGEGPVVRLARALEDLGRSGTTEGAAERVARLEQESSRLISALRDLCTELCA